MSPIKNHQDYQKAYRELAEIEKSLMYCAATGNRSPYLEARKQQLLRLITEYEGGLPLIPAIPGSCLNLSAN